MKRNSIQNRILSLLLGCSMAAASIAALPYSSLPVYADTEENTAGETGNKTVETKESEADKQNSDSTEKEGDENPTEMGGSLAINPISEGEADGSTSGTGSEGKLSKGADSAAQDKGTQKSRYHAVLVYSNGDNGLRNVPQKDAEAMKTMLCKTDQFSEADITTIAISYTEKYSSDPTQQIWDKLDAIAEETDENSVTLFFYVGHGGKSNADDICYLDISSENRGYNITAIELKSKLSKLKGSVMMILSACNSGGMLVQGIAEAEETDEETENIWSTQDEADEFAEEFQMQFLTGDEAASISMAEEGNDEGDQTTGTSSGPVYYAFTSATKVESAFEYPDIGSELVASLGNALGYDRNATEYQVYAADTETSSSGEARSGYAGDGQITMTELAAYVKRTSMTSTPVIYPDTDNQTVLFTYAEDEGTPAEFYAEISQEPEWDSTNKAYRITATVHNLTDHEIYLRGSVYTINNRTYGLTALNPDNELFREKCSYYDTANEVDDNEEENPYDSELVVTSIESGETRNITRILEDSDEKIYNQANDRSFNPLCLKLWECDEDGNSFSKGYSSYSYSGFYIKGNGNQSSGNVSKDALQYKYPTQFTAGQVFLIGGKTTASVTNVSNLVPIEIQYDTENGTVADTKLSAADCTLSMEALDLGTEEIAAQLNVYVESTTESDGKTSDHLYYNEDFYETYAAELEELDVLAGSKTIFNGVQPDRSRNGNEDAQQKYLRGSTYYYAMDTSWMQMDHYYVLDVTCTYSDKSEKHIYALVKKTSAEDAVYEIPKLEYSDSYSEDFATYSGGIPVGESWNNAYADWGCQVKDVTKQLESFLNKSGMGLYTNTIVSWVKPIPGGWMQLNDTDTFEAGTEYRCYIDISIKEEYNAVFTEKTAFSFGGHSIVEKSISNDGKTATICLSHTASSLAEISMKDLVTLTYVGGSNDGEEVGEEKLKVGDLITIDPGSSDFSIVKTQGLTQVKIEKDGTKYYVYEVVGVEPNESSEDSDSSTGHIEISVRNKHAGESHCMTLLYIHDVDLNEGMRTLGKISITKSDLQLYMTANGGMPTGDTWESGSITGLSGKVKDNKAAEYLSTLPVSRKYGISWEVERWTYRNAGTYDTSCPEDKGFENGRTVRSYLTLSLPKESRFQFVPDKSQTYHTEIEIDNHQVEIYSTTSGKTLNIVVNHIIPEELNEEAAGLKMYRVKDTGEVDTEVITESDTLKIGDRVVVGVNNGYEYYVMRGLTDTGEVTAIGEKIYEVTESTNKETSEKREFGGIEIVITMPPKDAKAAETNCGCGTLLYKHAIQYSSSLTITKDDLQSYIISGGGIPIGATWKSVSNSGLNGTVGANWLLKTLNSLDKFSKKGITYSDLKWTKDNKEQGFGNYFSSGSITSTMTVTLSDEWAMEFASSSAGSSASGQKANTIYYSEVEIDGHQVKMEINSSNPKKATVSVTHVIPSELNEASAGLKLKWVDGENAGKEVLETQKLQIGDRVTIKVNEGYEYHIAGGLEATDETTADGEVIYKVKEARNKTTGKRGGVEILITMPPKDTEDEGINCGCGTLLYKRTIDYSEKDTETITVTKEQLANYMVEKGGIPVGDTWKSGSITGFETVGTNQLAEYLESLDFFKKRSIEFTGLTWVKGSTESTLADDDNFTNGTVKSKMTVVLPDGDLEFAKELPESSDTDTSTHYYTGFEIDGHKVEVTIKNSKEAEITVTHSIPKELNEKDANLTLCWAEGDHAGEEISADTALEIGQTVTIDLASGYQCYPLRGLKDTGRKTKEGKIIYQVDQSLNSETGQFGGVEIVITMPPKDTEATETNCGCGTLLYKHDIQYSSTINISKENLQNYIIRNAGIPVGDTWKKGINQVLNGTVGHNCLQSYLSSEKSFYEWGIQLSGLTWKDSNGNILAGNSYFSNGTTVTSSMTFTLPSDRAMEFATQDDTSAHDANTIYYSGVTVAGHETTTSIVAGDSKKATVTVKHIIPEALNEKDAGVQLRWADGEHAGEVISKDTAIEVGQKVTVDINDGYEYQVSYGLEETGEVSDGKKIYKVIAKQSGDSVLLGVALLITMPTTDEKTNCGCGTLLYMHDTTNSTSGDAWYYPDTSKDPETITITRGEMENYHALTSSGEMDGGIPVGDVWKEGSTTGVQGTVGANRLADYLNSMDFFKKRAIQFTDLTWIDGESGEEMDDSSYFNYGSMKSTLLMELPFGSDLEFARESKDSSDEASGTHYYTGFEIEGHKVEMTILDNKTAQITIEHQIPESLNAEDAGLKLYRVKNREIAEEIGTDTALWLGEYVAIELDEAYAYEVISGLQDTGKKTSDGRKIYVVANYKTGNYGGVELLLSMPQTDYNADMNCGCGTVLYKHSIARSAGNGGSSRGTGWRTFYSRGSGSYSTMFYGGRETLIQNYVLTENMMQYYRVSAGGIPVGDNWTTGSLSKLSSKTEDNLLAMFMDSMAGGSFNHSVIWSKYDAATGQETVMSGTDIFRQGEQYVSTITISVAKGYRMVFSSATHFGFSGHELLGEPVISADGKSATVKILHTIPQMDENAVKLYLADTGEEVTSETVLQPGDRVRIVMAGGYGYHILCGLQYSGEDDIYIVEYGRSSDGEIGGIEIMAFLNGTLNLDGCLCGTLLYKHAVGTVSYSQVLGADRKAAENAGLVTLAVANGTTISRDGAVAETGDDGELLRWLLLSLGSAAGLAGTKALRKRRSRRRR